MLTGYFLFCEVPFLIPSPPPLFYWVAYIFLMGLQVFFVYLGYGFSVGFGPACISSPPHSPLLTLWCHLLLLYPLTIPFHHWVLLPGTALPGTPRLRALESLPFLLEMFLLRDSPRSLPTASRLCSIVTFFLVRLPWSTCLVLHHPLHILFATLSIP